MQKQLPGAGLGVAVFGSWALMSAADPGSDLDASICAFLASAAAGAILVSYLPFLAGLVASALCFVLWAASTRHGIHGFDVIMLPVLMGWVLGVASLGFALGVLVRYSLMGLLDRLTKR